MATGFMREQNLENQIEKQMGCMAGFLQIFDRHQILSGKRLQSAGRLPPFVLDSESESDNAVASPAMFLDSDKLNQTRPTLSTAELRPPPLTPLKTLTDHSLPLHVPDFKESIRSSWKFSKEAPRLSLDSRAVIDTKGSIYPREIGANTYLLAANRNQTSIEKQHRSPSVIGRLMGLEPLSNSDSEPVKKSELRRSSSESRVSKDFYQYRFVDGNNFLRKQSNLQGNTTNTVITENVANRVADRKEFGARTIKGEASTASNRIMGQRNSFFDSADFFSEQKETESVYGDMGRTLKMGGSNESSKDLETLRQILEALQLKGLLRSKRPPNQMSQRTMVQDEHLYQRKSAIVVMKPVKSVTSCVRSRAGARWSSNIVGETFPAASLRHERTAQNPLGGRHERSLGVKSPSSRGGPLKVETQRRPKNDPVEQSQRRISPIQSPKTSPRRNGVDPQATNRTAKNKKSTAKDESSTSVSESSSDIERWSNYKVVENGGGNNLLHRCDKLLTSIAEITAAELQPSPVSVLGSSFYKDESSPSPVLKRHLHSKDQQVEVEDDVWSEGGSSGELQRGDWDFAYISDILRASNYFPQDSINVFLLLEKQQHGEGRDSKVSTLNKKLTFDAINEILERNRQLPPWRRSSSSQPVAQQIWGEIRRAQERDEQSEDLLDVIRSVLRRDLATDAVEGWGDWPVLTSPLVLDMERLIFKDLIDETIQHQLALFGSKCRTNHHTPRRKLVF